MRNFLPFCLLLICVSAFSQDKLPVTKVRIDVKSDSIVLMHNGMEKYPPIKISDVYPSWVYIARRNGYVNEGFTFKELAGKGTREYMIDLKKIQPLPADYQSKMIEVYKVSDRTGQAIKIEANDPYFLTALSDKMVSFGYKNVTNTDLFDTKQKDTQLKIVGEITQFSKSTFGPAFQISLIVNWSVYDVAQQKVVLQYSGAGYSNTESPFKKELGLALKNALTGLLSSEEFQELAKARE